MFGRLLRLMPLHCTWSALLHPVDDQQVGGAAGGLHLLSLTRFGHADESGFIITQN